MQNELGIGRKLEYMLSLALVVDVIETIELFPLATRDRSGSLPIFPFWEELSVLQTTHWPLKPNKMKMLHLVPTQKEMGVLGLCGKHSEGEGSGHHADSRAQGFSL